MTSNLPARRTADKWANAPASPEAPFCVTFRNGQEAGRRVCLNLGKAARAARQNVHTLEDYLAEATAADAPTSIDTELAKRIERNLAESRLAQTVIDRLIAGDTPPHRRCQTCHLFGEVIDGTVGDEPKAGDSTPAIQASPPSSGIVET